MKNNIVKIVGAGPGAIDLITLRGFEAIKMADIIIYAGSLVNPKLLEFANENCKIFDSAKINLTEIISIIKNGVMKNLKVVRLHTGDPAIYGAIAEQMNELDALNIQYEIIPGVSSVFASAATLKTELTMPGISQTVILTRREGRTPVPNGQEIENLAKAQSTMCIFLSVADMQGLINDLLKGGYKKSTAIAVVYRASWDNEQIVEGTLDDIYNKVISANITRQAMIIVGNAITRKGEYSLLYDANFSHGYRSECNR